LEDEIFELRSKNSSQDEDNSQAMDIDEDEELPYESIDLTDLPGIFEKSVEKLVLLN